MTAARAISTPSKVFLFSLDALLLVLTLLLLTSPRLTGLTLHEWIGTGLLVPLLVLVCAHVAMNWRWIMKVADRFIPGQLKQL